MNIYPKRNANKVGRRVLPDGRSGELYRREPYASLSSTLLASKSFRSLSPPAVGVLILLHANYVPKKLTSLSHRQACRMLQASATTIVAAFRAIEAKNLAKKISPGWAPGRMGGGHPAERHAAVYDLPGRTINTALEWKGAEDRSIAGSWRIHVGQLRRLAETLSGKALKLLCAFHARRHIANGTLERNDPRLLGELGDGLALSRSAIRRAVLELLEEGFVEVVEPGRGRKPTTYRLTTKANRGIAPQSKRRSRDLGSGLNV